MLPVALLNDGRLKHIDVRAVGVLRAIDVDNDDVSLVSLERLAERLFCSVRTAERSIRRLERAGWILSIDHGVGLCKSYLLTPVRGDGSAVGTTAVGDAESPSSVTRTPVIAGQQPIRCLNFLLEDPDQKDGGDDELRALVENLRPCLPSDPRDQDYVLKEARRIADLLPGKLHLFIGHLCVARRAGHQRPISYAVNQTKRAARPT